LQGTTIGSNETITAYYSSPQLGDVESHLISKHKTSIPVYVLNADIKESSILTQSDIEGKTSILKIL
jgi:hypothetical protein